MSPALPLILVLLAGAGCAAAPARPAHSPGGGAALTLSLQVDALPLGAILPRPVTRGETLRSGDRVGLSIKADRAAHLYLVHFSRTGWSQLLLPVGPEETPAPAGPLRVPTGGQWMVLDDEIGEETFVVVAAPRPILEIDPGFCGRLRLHCPGERSVAQSRSSQSPPPPPPPPPPLGIDPRDRSGAGEGQAVTAQADARGVAVLRFSLVHAARTP